MKKSKWGKLGIFQSLKLYAKGIKLWYNTRTPILI